MYLSPQREVAVLTGRLASFWSTDTIGKSADFRRCECPSVYPLPPPTPGTEAEYAKAALSGLPSHVHKTSCHGDWWQLGSNDAGTLERVCARLARWMQRSAMASHSD